MVDPDILRRARQRLAAATVVPHTDADGLAAAAIALRYQNKTDPDAAHLLPRGRQPFDPETPLPDGDLAILDWGVRKLDRPAVLVDHHSPEAEPATDQVLVSGFDEADEGVSTSVLMRRVVPDAPAWLAAVGAAGDYGDKGLARPECAGVVKSHVKKLVPLINAPRRGPDLGPVRTALAILLDNDSAKEALADARIAELEEAKAAWKAAFEAAVKTAPKYVGPYVAVLSFSSSYQVHPLVAQAWARRLKPRIVMAANGGYLPGRINFACRTDGDHDIRALLRKALPDQTGEYAHGHARATGGSLNPADFERLLHALGRT